MKPIQIFNALKNKPFGKFLFSKAVCFQAPYFSSIKPKVNQLQKNLCEVSINDKRRVRNHLGTVHAIAMCNMAELSAGMMTDVSIPKGARWIPSSMTVNYVKKAKGKLTATADGSAIDWNIAGTKEVPVSVKNQAGEEVFNARISMNVKLAA